MDLADGSALSHRGVCGFRAQGVEELLCNHLWGPDSPGNWVDERMRVSDRCCFEISSSYLKPEGFEAVSMD